MSLTEGLLIVIILVLTVLVFTSRNRGHKSPRSRAWECVDNETGESTTVKMSYGNASPEVKSQLENAEYFTTCKSDADAKKALDCLCDPDGDFAYAVNEFGGPGMDYKDWVTAQSVDPAVIKNHAGFVKDQTKSNVNITGRTYSPDSHDSYDPVPWQGLFRPQAVPVCNPTQVPDVDYDLYNKERKFAWKS